MIPMISRITPTVWMLRPDTVAVTAQVRIAPAAISSRLTPTPIVPPSLVGGASGGVLPVSFGRSVKKRSRSAYGYACSHRVPAPRRGRLAPTSAQGCSPTARAVRRGRLCDCRRRRPRAALAADASLPAGASHRRRLLVRHRDLRRDLRDRRRRAHLLADPFPGAAGRRLGRAADSRTYGTGDRMDGRAVRPWDVDGDHQRDRARARRPPW